MEPGRLPRVRAEQVQFNQPTGGFQAIRHKLATRTTKGEAARALTLLVADAVDSDKRVDAEDAMAKLFASEIAEEVTSEGIQIHGEYGYMTDFKVERYRRNARLTKILKGQAKFSEILSLTRFPTISHHDRSSPRSPTTRFPNHYRLSLEGFPPYVRRATVGVARWLYQYSLSSLGSQGCRPVLHPGVRTNLASLASTRGWFHTEHVSLIGAAGIPAFCNA